MMDGTFVTALKDQMRGPSLIDVDGNIRVVSPKDWQDITPPQDSIAPLAVNTLSGVCDYLASGSELARYNPFLLVQSYKKVLLLDQIEPETQHFRRKCFLVATHDTIPFRFGEYVDAEAFFVGLQSLFVETPERNELLALIASIKESTVRETVDNGVGQEVKTGKGVVLVGMQKVPNPITLRPFRTFREIEQPDSLFTLRLRSATAGDKPQCALFESDGGLWTLEAIAGIKSFLRGKVSVPVIG